MTSTTSNQSIPKLPAGVKLSGVFHLAADEFLAVNQREAFGTDRLQKFSCCAIEVALEEIFEGNWRVAQDFQEKVVNVGLEALGLYTASTTSYLTMGCRPGHVSEDAQGARYAWLKFCAMLAEEQEAAGASWN